MMSTRCQALMRPASRRPWMAVSAETGTTAACSKLSPAGLWASLSSRAAAYSAKEPRLMPNTSSPTWNLVTSEPTANDRASHVQSGDWVLRTTEAKAHDPHQVRLARHDVPGTAIHPGGTHL